MKTEKRTITQKVDVEINVYIADDGKEFENFLECEAYDNRIKQLEGIETCTALRNRANINGGENLEYSEYFWYKPKNAEEIKILNTVYHTINKIPDDCIGKWLCIEVSEWGADSWYSELGIEYAIELLDKLGYDVMITERK